MGLKLVIQDEIVAGKGERLTVLICLAFKSHNNINMNCQSLKQVTSQMTLTTLFQPLTLE